jgi:hypothetical protein
LKLGLGPRPFLEIHDDDVVVFGVYAYESDTGDCTAPVADEDHGGGGMDAG